MSSEKIASAVNILKGNLAAGWDIISGSQGESERLGIARRFGGSAAAYSLRDIGAVNGRVVRVRRDSDDVEEDFSANQVQSSALENWVNGKLENTLPADVATAAAAYSLRKVKASYASNAVRIRRSSDDAEVNVAFDSDDKVSASSDISVVSGTVNETDLNGFLNPTYTVGTSVESATRTFNSFTSNGNDGFTATKTGGGSSTGGFPYTFATGDVISVSFDLVIADSASPTFILSGNNMGSGSVGTGTTFTSSGSYTQVVTTTSGTGTHIAFTDGNTGTFTVSNFQVTSHKAEAFVHTWYDQAGSNNAVQATDANQPQIASSGALLADGIDLDGTNDELRTSTNIASSQPVTVMSVTKPDAVNKRIFESITNTVRSFYGSNSETGLNAGATLLGSTDDISINNEYLQTHLFNTTSSKVFLNSVESASGNGGSNAFAGNFSIGGSSALYDGTIKELIIYTSDQTNNRFKIESNINNYYGLYTTSGNGFVSIWYDQSTSGNNAVQATAGNQPSIVQSGGICKSNGSPSVLFTGDTRDDELDFTDLTLTDAAIFTVVNIDSSADQQLILGGGSVSTSTGTMIPMMDNGSSTTQVYKNATVGGAEQGSSQFKNGSAVTLADRDDAFDNLAVDSQILFTMIDVDVAEAKVLDGISRPPTDAVGFHLQGHMNELIIYNSDQSSDRGDIELEIANHYSITLS